VIDYEPEQDLRHECRMIRVGPEKPWTVARIVTAWLREHGYDGLYRQECGCLIEDFMPCGGEGIDDCMAGYRHPCACGAECEALNCVHVGAENVLNDYCARERSPDGD